MDLDEEDYHNSEIYGIAISFGEHCYYESKEDMLKDSFLLEALKNESIAKNAYDSKSLSIGAKRLGIAINGVAFDLLLGAYSLDSSSGSIKGMAAYFGASIPEEGLSLLDPSHPELTAFLANMALLKEKDCRKALEAQSSYSLYQEIEFPLANILAEMESEGFPVHKEVLESIGEDFKKKLVAAEKEVYALAGHSFNIASPKQVGEVLYNEMGLPHSKSMSTSAETLLSLSFQAPIAGKILEYRKYAKLLGTYIEGLLPHIGGDGKIHTCFNQAQTATGRLSSSNPNLQNISARDPEGKQIRKAFYYDDPDIAILSMDYHQIELRILAALSGCKAYQEVFQTNRDVHEETARRIFNIPQGESVPSELRRRAKAINFAIIYGTTPFGLAEQIGTSPKQASEVIESFYLAYPEIRDYLNKIISEAQRKGYVETILGRRRYLKDLTDPSYMKREAAKRAALNAPVQGSAADLIKKAMISISSFLKQGGYQTKMVLQIHDELLFKGPLDELKSLEGELGRLMTEAMDLPVNLTVESSIGKTWYEAKD